MWRWGGVEARGWVGWPTVRGVDEAAGVAGGGGGGAGLAGGGGGDPVERAGVLAISLVGMDSAQPTSSSMPIAGMRNFTVGYTSE